MITEEDIQSVKYFAREKGDHTRYCRWQEIRRDFYLMFPDFRDAVADKVRAEKRFVKELDSLTLGDSETDTWA